MFSIQNINSFVSSIKCKTLVSDSHTAKYDHDQHSKSEKSDLFSCSQDCSVRTHGSLCATSTQQRSGRFRQGSLCIPCINILKVIDIFLSTALLTLGNVKWLNKRRWICYPDSVPTLLLLLMHSILMMTFFNHVLVLMMEMFTNECSKLPRKLL